MSIAEFYIENCIDPCDPDSFNSWLERVKRDDEKEEEYICTTIKEEELMIMWENAKTLAPNQEKTITEAEFEADAVLGRVYRESLKNPRFSAVSETNAADQETSDRTVFRETAARLAESVRKDRNDATERKRRQENLLYTPKDVKKAKPSDTCKCGKIMALQCTQKSCATCCPGNCSRHRR
mmetsp:Transcript_13849/g.19838  ORF Transcript_13849/g.19838 Transcript_13849/m.19838 type:complete len:181 (-) Transcript_13849:192-734(-)